MDDRPIQQSDRVLIQVVTVNRLTGWKTRDARFTVGRGPRAYEVQGEQIVSTGRPPLRIANTRVEVRFKVPRLKRAIVLNLSGYEKARLPIANGRLRLPAEAIYVIATP